MSEFKEGERARQELQFEIVVATSMLCFHPELEQRISMQTANAPGSSVSGARVKALYDV
jgi:hypothetical protein